MILDIAETQKQADTLRAEINELEAQKNHRGGIMITGHNAILALVDWNNRVSHIVDTSTSRNLVMIYELDRHLAVQRFTPKAAKNWLAEPLKLHGGNDELSAKMSKRLLSESELREIVIQDKTITLGALEKLLKGLKNGK